MILPTGRSRMVLLGVAVLVVLAGASFLVFNLGTDSVSSQELPIVRIGQVADQTGEGQEPPDSTTVTVDATDSSSSSGGDSYYTPGSSGYTQTTVRQFVQEDVRMQNAWPTRDDSTVHGDKDGGPSRQPGSGRR